MLPSIVMLVSIGWALSAQYYEDPDLDHLIPPWERDNDPSGSDDESVGSEEFDACHLRIYKPLSAQVAFFILKTPVWAGKPPKYEPYGIHEDYILSHPRISKSTYAAAPPSFSPVAVIRTV